MMCADGYLPIATVDEPPMPANVSYQKEEVLVQYFSCCPPAQNYGEVVRQCSDPITNPNNNETLDSFCDSYATWKQPRSMKPNVEIQLSRLGLAFEYPKPIEDSFLCCNSNTNNTIGNETTTRNETNFIEGTQCVPYRNEYYQASKIHNRVGSIPFMSCDFTEGDFPFARLRDGPAGLYHCCKDGPEMQNIYVQDSAFILSIYLPFALYVIGVIISAVVFLGLLIPLLVQLKEKTYRIGSYSPYNMYLVCLSFFDLVGCVTGAVVHGIALVGKFNSNFNGDVVRQQLSTETSPIGSALVVFSGIANVWLNGFIVYEILVLLRTSRESRRVTPVSLSRVILQAIVASFISAMYSLGLYFTLVAMKRAIEDDNVDRSNTLWAFFLIPTVLVTLPMCYSMIAVVLIWKRNYLPTTVQGSANERAVRELAFYFLRIISVFLSIWFPIFIFFTLASVSDQTWTITAMNFLLPIQPVISFFVILTKADAKKYILDLVTLSYLRRKPNENTTIKSVTKKTRDFVEEGNNGGDV